MVPVQVSGIPDEGLRLDVVEDPAGLELTAPGAQFYQPITGELRLNKIGTTVQASGRLAAAVMFECVRCLKKFAAMLQVPITAQYVQGAPPVLLGQHVMPEEDAENYYYRGDELALEELIRQEVLLALPFNPQCRTDCRGLCPQCGQDLNAGPCACAPPLDPRLAPLQEYFKKP